MFDLLDTLDDEQRAVATCAAPRIRVLAGAGTGKTTALTSRVAHLVINGTPAERVLLLTFTRRAARQMVSRTASLLAGHSAAGQRKPGQIVGGTFHSVAHRVLRQHACRIGLSEGFAVIDPSDASDLIDVVRDGVLSTRVGGRVAARRFPRKATLLDIYSRAVDTAQPLSDVVPDIAPWCTDDIDAISEICRGYVTRKRRLGLLDFDDLLLHWREALRHPTVGPALVDCFDHVLVDEYQDVNALQVDVLRNLGAGDRKLTVVGDDAQSIYSFRASTPRHILDFELDFPGATTLPLTTNYRSTSEILAIANAVGSEATEGFSTVLRPARPAHSGRSEPPTLVRCADEDGQSDAVCERVLELLESGIALRRQAVLIRAAHHSDRLELELTRRGIPFVKYGGLRYLEAAHVKDLLATFRLADNPRDELSWFRLLQLLEGVGPAIARRAVGQLGLLAADAEGEDAGVFLRWPLACEQLPRSVRPLADAVAGALIRQSGEPLAAQAQRLRLAMVPLIESAYDNSVARLTDLDALVDMSAHVNRLSEVAADHALEPTRSTGELAGPPTIDEDWLVISTVHSAKGLEWDVVHLIHAADGNFPSDMALSTIDGLEEERRLFYVALTRPKRHLHVYVPLRYHHNPSARNDRHSWAQPSRFVTGAAAEAFVDVTYTRVGAIAAVDLPSADTTSSVDSALDSLWR